MHVLQGFKDFVNEIGTLASLQHPQLCKLIGFYAREGSDQRMVVYERLYHGSLDQLLYGRSDGPPVDWCARIKVALCAAQGLAFLHEEGPFQVLTCLSRQLLLFCKADAFVISCLFNPYVIFTGYVQRVLIDKDTN